jgi:hypothetical protein
MIPDLNSVLEGAVSEDSAAKPNEKDKKPEGRWALFTGIGTFLLYFFGYLALRFHLSVLGIDTGLSVLDERYLFTGAQFLVYLVTSLPLALFFVFVARWLGRRFFRRFLHRPAHAIILGIVLSAVLIQFVMRQCLPFTGLLFRSRLPEPEWMQALLLDDTGALQPLYFTVLLAFILGQIWTLFQDARWKTWSWPAPNWVLALFVLIQFLLLPVTFGILIENQNVPKVTTMDGKEMLKSNVQAWRVWEAKDSVTFFVRRWDKDRETRRALLTLDKKNIEKTEISGQDHLLRALYPWPGVVRNGDLSNLGSDKNR